MNKRILSPEQKEKNRINARKYYNEHKEKCNAYGKQRRLEIKNDPILNQQMKDYKKEWTRNKRKKDKENAELVIKYKIVLDKIKEYIKNGNLKVGEMANLYAEKDLLELLEEIE